MDNYCVLYDYSVQGDMILVMWTGGVEENCHVMMSTDNIFNTEDSRLFYTFIKHFLNNIMIWALIDSYMSDEYNT